MSPLFSSFFLVFTGMFFGYFLFYRDRSADEAMRASLRRDNDDLHTSLKLAHNSHEQLDDRFTRQKGQLNVLQQLCDDWSNSREQSELDRVQLEVEVANKNQLCEEAVSELQIEKQKRIALEDETHKLTQLQITKLSELEDDWRQRHAKIESSLFQRQADLKSTSGEKERITNQLHDAQSRIAELQADLTTPKSLLKNAIGMKQAYVPTESSLQENSELLKDSRAQCAIALSAQKVTEESLAELKEIHETAQVHLEELRAKLTTIEATDSQVASHQQSLANVTVQLGKVASQRDDALAAETNMIAVSKGLQNRIDNQEATIHGLRAKHDDAMENLKLELVRRTELETSFDQKSADFEDRMQAEAAESLPQTSIGLESAKQQKRELTAKIEELKTTCLRISQLEELVQHRDQEDELVKEELHTLRQQYADSNGKQQELQLELEQVTSQSKQLESDSTSHHAQLDQLRVQVKAGEETIRTLRHERAAVLARLANSRTVAEPDATVISFAKAMQRRQEEATNYDQEYGGLTSQHSVRGLVYTEAPESQDDLKRISGIAEVLEARLNDYGIYTFKQIMDWNPQAIEEFSRLLSFKDRIVRDDWLRQAEFFYKQQQKRIAA